MTPILETMVFKSVGRHDLAHDVFDFFDVVFGELQCACRWAP